MRTLLLASMMVLIVADASISAELQPNALLVKLSLDRIGREIAKQKCLAPKLTTKKIENTHDATVVAFHRKL
jgi:hypothetical protein